MSEETWGPWIEHDGKGCPVGDGVAVNATDCRGRETISCFRYGGESWDWSNWPEYTRIIRFRIRKPRGLTILENLIADLPAPVGPKVDA